MLCTYIAAVTRTSVLGWSATPNTTGSSWSVTFTCTHVHAHTYTHTHTHTHMDSALRGERSEPASKVVASF